MADHRCVSGVTGVYLGSQVCIWDHRCVSRITGVYLGSEVCLSGAGITDVIWDHRCVSGVTGVCLESQACIQDHRGISGTTSVGWSHRYVWEQGVYLESQAYITKPGLCSAGASCRLSWHCAKRVPPAALEIASLLAANCEPARFLPPLQAQQHSAIHT